MSGRLRSKIGALAGAFGLVLTTVVVALPSQSSVKVLAAPPAEPITATDASKVPHYFGPYSNWANSQQTLANAVVGIDAPPGPGGVRAQATATVLPKNPVTNVVGGITGDHGDDPGLRVRGARRASRSQIRA